MGREVDAAISRCYIRRAVGSDSASQPSVHIVAGDLHIVVSTEEAGQALQRETQVDPLSEVIPALAEGRGDHVAVNGGAARFNIILVDVSFEDRGMCRDLHDAVAVMFSDRGASQPAKEAADQEAECNVEGSDEPESRMHPRAVKLQEVNSAQTAGADYKYREQLLRAYRFLQEAVGCVMYMDQLMNRPGSEPLRDLLVHPLAVQLQEVKSAQKALEIVTKLCLEEGF